MTEEVELDDDELVAMLKSVCYQFGGMVMASTDPKWNHYQLCARGSKASGVWFLYIRDKTELEEDGPVGHAD